MCNKYYQTSVSQTININGTFIQANPILQPIKFK